jgi:tRNA dimethylallyltransferase
MSAPHRTLAVCGPTASGKSALSLELARALSGEIVNIDSVQVYRELDIGSAKLRKDEQGSIPHHVLDVFSPEKAGNVAEFRSAALSAIGDITRRDHLPILVGGSGLYVTALLHGLAELPSTPADVRAAVGALSADQQYNELLQVDPITAKRLNPNDRQRVSRALEVYRITGQPLSQRIAQHGFSSVDVASLVLVICRPRDELYRRIDKRAQEMVERGLIAETKTLLSRYGRLPILETLGYKQACDHLEGKLSHEKLAHEIAMHTRRFAKRQMTYWRNEPSKRGWVSRPSADEPAVEVQGFTEFSPRAQKTIKGFRAFEWSADELLRKVTERLTKPLQTTEVWYVSPNIARTCNDRASLHIA